MRWKDIMNPKRTDVTSVGSFPAGGEILESDLGAVHPSDVYIRIVDQEGNCVGSVRREILEYFWSVADVKLAVAILDKIDEAVIAIDRAGRIYYINPAYTKILGVTPGKVIGRYLQDVEPESALLTILTPPHTPVIQNEQLIRSLNRYVSIHAYPIFLHGEFRGAVSIFTDVTRINRLNQEVERISQVASEYNRQLEAEQILKQNHVIGSSKTFLCSVMKTVTVARTDATVLLRGENGVGKEIFAQLLRENSLRKGKPFISMNCSAIPEALIESELFGYEDGAFTGAKRGGSFGKFQLAQGGTLFLDEIGDMPMSMQAKLLRVLQEGEIEKIGRQKNIPVDVRVIAATNQPLESLIKENRFREDLYYRLNVVSIQIPPLRERGNDIILLVDHFLSVYNQKYHKQLIISEDVYQRFLSYSWPGNVRELQNVMESIVVLSPGSVVRPEYLPEQIAQLQPPAAFRSEPSPLSLPADPNQEFVSLSEQISRCEREIIVKTLRYFEGNRAKAIAALGVSRRTFYRKLSQYHLD